MTALTNAEIGSVVLGIIDNVPAGISGLITTLVNQQIYFAEQLTGNTIGTTVADAYQPAIINLTIGNVLSLMEAQGMGTRSVSIGELSLTKGMQEGTSKEFRDLGIKQLQEIGQRMSYYQCWD
jgi:hypothetical protein